MTITENENTGKLEKVIDEPKTRSKYQEKMARLGRWVIGVGLLGNVISLSGIGYYHHYEYQRQQELRRETNSQRITELSSEVSELGKNHEMYNNIFAAVSISSIYVLLFGSLMHKVDGISSEELLDKELARTNYKSSYYLWLDQ